MSLLNIYKKDSSYKNTIMYSNATLVFKPKVTLCLGFLYSIAFTVHLLLLSFLIVRLSSCPSFLLSLILLPLLDLVHFLINQHDQGVASPLQLHGRPVFDERVKPELELDRRFFEDYFLGHNRFLSSDVRFIALSLYNRFFNYPFPSIIDSDRVNQDSYPSLSVIDSLNNPSFPFIIDSYQAKQDL